MNALKRIFGGDTRQFGMIIALVALVLFFQLFTSGKVLTPTNMINLFNGNSYILVLAIGMVMVIIAGHIDLSVGSVAAAVGIVVAIAMRDWGIPWYLGIVLGIVLGAVIGSWQGFWVAYVGIPAFIVTLAGMLLFRGINQFVGKSLTVPVPDEFRSMGAGFLPEIGDFARYNWPTVILGVLLIVGVVYLEFRRRRLEAKTGSTPDPLWVPLVRLGLLAAAVLYVTWLFSTGRYGTSFPVSGLILVGLVALYAFITTKTVLGRHVYAVGGNRHAAELSGVRSKKINFLVMMNMSIMASLAGMMFVARSTSSGPADGVGWELDAIAAVFIGGAAVSGGVGTVIGSIVGGLVMAVLNNGLQLLSVGADMQSIIKGLVLLVAVAIDVYNKSQGRRSIIGMLMNGLRSNQPVITADETTKTRDVIATPEPAEPAK